MSLCSYAANFVIEHCAPANFHVSMSPIVISTYVTTRLDLTWFHARPCARPAGPTPQSVTISMDTQRQAAPRQQFQLIRNVHNSKFDFGICVHRSRGNRFQQMCPCLSLSRYLSILSLVSFFSALLGTFFVNFVGAIVGNGLDWVIFFSEVFQFEIEESCRM